MSSPLRWILAVLLVLIALGAAIAMVLGGAFSTVACTKTPPDWIYYSLLGAGIAAVGVAVSASVALVRRARRLLVFGPIAVGLVFLCLGSFGYFALLGQYC